MEVQHVDLGDDGGDRTILTVLGWDGKPLPPGTITDMGEIPAPDRSSRPICARAIEPEEFERMRDERRLKRIYLPEREVFDVMTRCITGNVGRLALRFRGGLPHDVEVLPGVIHCWERRAFGFLLRHKSFAPVADGDVIPCFDYKEYRWEWVVDSPNIEEILKYAQVIYEMGMSLDGDELYSDQGRRD